MTRGDVFNAWCRCAAAGLLLAWAGAAGAGVGLRGTVELTAILKKQPACCVIDARSDTERARQPVREAVLYRSDVQIVPTATVVVVASNDEQGQRIAAALSARYPGKDIYAVKGGVQAWESMLKTLEKVSASAAPPQSGLSFVIPHNTCETGTPLQVLSTAPPKKP